MLGGSLSTPAELDALLHPGIDLGLQPTNGPAAE
jgi:hypothetical protein